MHVCFALIFVLHNIFRAYIIISVIQKILPITSGYQRISYVPSKLKKCRILIHTTSGGSKKENPASVNDVLVLVLNAGALINTCCKYYY